MKKLTNFSNEYNTFIFVISIVVLVMFLVFGRSSNTKTEVETENITNSTTEECVCDDTSSDTENLSYKFTYTTDETTKSYNIEKENGRYTITNEIEAYYILYSNVYKLIGKDFVIYRANIIDNIDNNIFVYDYLMDLKSDECTTFDNYIICYYDSSIKVTGSDYEIVLEKTE